MSLSSGESELYALGAFSTKLIFAQAILEKSDSRESRQQHCTRNCNETRSESQDETHTHDIPVHSIFSVPESANVVGNQDRCKPE